MQEKKMKFGVCIDTVFLDKSVPDRVREIKKIGYDGIEFWYHDYYFDGKDLLPGERDIEGLKKALDETGMVCSDFVWLSPDGSIDNASLVKPDDFDRAMARLEKIIPVANFLECKKLIVCTGNDQENMSLNEQRKSV